MKERRREHRRSLLLAAVSVVAVSACASMRPIEAPVPAPLQTAGATPSSDGAPPPAPEQVLAVTPEMRGFLERYVPRRVSQPQRLERLAEALLHPGLLGVEYQATATHTASETFQLRSGNCISISLLFVAMARELGLDADFQEVQVAPKWDRVSGVLLNFRHVNVVGDIAQYESYTMDFGPTRTQRRTGVKRLSDAEAIAHFYNNRGSDYLLDGRLAEAHVWYLRSIEQAPGLSYAWSNLALVYQRAGQGDEAERLLRHAIRLDAQNTSAIANLSNLLDADGRLIEAAQLKAQVRKTLQRNPYHLYALAERAVDLGEREEALRLLDQAIRLKPEDASFYPLAAEIARSIGDQERALAYEALADALTQAKVEPRSARRRAQSFALAR